jgi:hypothetical protein
MAKGAGLQGFTRAGATYALTASQPVDTSVSPCLAALRQTSCAPPPASLQVFVYLADLHQRKLAAGQLGAQQQQQSQSSPPGSSSAPATGANRPGFAGESGGNEERARTVDLGPSKQRTGGKKSFKDKLSCSIL